MLWVVASSDAGERLLLLNMGGSIQLDEVAGWRREQSELLLACLRIDKWDGWLTVRSGHWQWLCRQDATTAWP